MEASYDVLPRLTTEYIRIQIGLKAATTARLARPHAEARRFAGGAQLGDLAE